MILGQTLRLMEHPRRTSWECIEENCRVQTCSKRIHSLGVSPKRMHRQILLPMTSSFLRSSYFYDPVQIIQRLKISFVSSMSYSSRVAMIMIRNWQTAKDLADDFFQEDLHELSITWRAAKREQLTIITDVGISSAIEPYRTEGICKVYLKVIVCSHHLPLPMVAMYFAIMVAVRKTI